MFHGKYLYIFAKSGVYTNKPEGIYTPATSGVYTCVGLCRCVADVCEPVCVNVTLRLVHPTPPPLCDAFVHVTHLYYTRGFTAFHT